MSIFSNKWYLISISSVLLVLIVSLLFPNIFGAKKMMQSEDPEIVQSKTLSKDTSANAIQKDLESTDIENVDREMKLIETEVNASL